MTRNIDILVLASGGSTRMRGDDKLLRKIDGVALLRRVVLRACDSTARAVHVTLRPNDTERAQVLAGIDVVPVTVPNWESGMSRSLVTGIKAFPMDADAVLIVLADMPDVTTQDMNDVMAAYQTTADICQATNFDGAVGHPVLFGSDYFDALRNLDKDQGARVIISQNKKRLRLVPTLGHHATTDLDTPEDWDAYEA